MIHLALINRLHKVEKIDEQLAADVAAVFFDQKDYPTVYGYFREKKKEKKAKK